MKLEQINVNFLTHTLTHTSASEVKTITLNKKSMNLESLKYIEDYCNKTGFELLAPMIETSVFVYHLVKK